MKLPLLLKGEIHARYVPVMNFFYLVVYTQSNDRNFIIGFLISFSLYVFTSVSIKHHSRKAIESERTKMTEMMEDISKDIVTGIIACLLFIMFLISFYIILNLEWIYPYSFLVILLNIGFIVSLIAQGYYERDLVRIPINKWKDRFKK